MADRVEIYLLDQAGQPAGILDQALKFAATVRWQDLGAVSLTARVENPGASEIKPGARTAILVDGIVFASGPFARIQVDEDTGGRIITASGPDDLAMLDGMIGYPAAPSIDPTAAVSSDISGPAETVIYGYVDRNLGPGSGSRQRVRTGPDHGRGSTVNESVRFEQILTVANRVALVDDLGLRCRWDPVTKGLPLFEVAAARDLRAQIEFSDARGTLSQASWVDIAPSGTHVLVAGSGTGVARQFAQVNDDPAAAEWYRVETFVDAGDVTDVGTLTQRAQGSLQQAGRVITLEAIETAGQQFGDWQLGDIVTGVAGDRTDVFFVVAIELSGPPLRLRPTLSQFAGYRLGQLSAVQQRILSQRLRSQETT